MNTTKLEFDPALFDELDDEPAGPAVTPIQGIRIERKLLGIPARDLFSMGCGVLLTAVVAAVAWPTTKAAAPAEKTGNGGIQLPAGGMSMSYIPKEDGGTVPVLGRPAAGTLQPQYATHEVTEEAFDGSSILTVETRTIDPAAALKTAAGQLEASKSGAKAYRVTVKVTPVAQ